MQGVRDSQGAAGARGPKEEQGIQGPQGKTGAKDAIDAIGAQGFAGIDSSTPNTQVGAATTLAAGNAATMKRRAGSLDAAPIFGSDIPRGADAVNPGGMTEVVYDPKSKARSASAYADQEIPKTGGALTGGVSGVSPVNGSTKGSCSIYFDSGAPASSLEANGNVYTNIG